MQKAEYRNRMEGMETGRTEEEISTAGTAVRGKREEGKGKCGKLSSQNRAKRTKESVSEGKARRRKQKGSYLRNGCGSESGKDERKQTEGRVQEAEGKHGKPGGTEAESQEAERRMGGTR